ncbi:hypothetical protein [Flavobacterium humi]|uniref:Uncharacterized protein n=1 Tax=Flavobacterium humi TaxID=2562683 RepID=A0A4Z0LD15_9FLAO|nr:hypothetical protein [Flavobacterium humi]TGD59767.1 hypothetical protein E4635_02210 [Flavobacterium humi]
MRKLFFLLMLFFSAAAVQAQSKIENLKVVWPEEYKWKVGSSQENEASHFMELIPEKESLDNWTIIGTMLSLKNVSNIPMDKAMNLFYSKTKNTAPGAKLTLIEKKDGIKNSWILFKVEVEKYLNNSKPESQVYYIVQGDATLYVNIVGVKEKTISKSFEEKWSKIFKSSQLVLE